MDSKMTIWQNIWNRIRAVPAGLWAALGVALTLLGLYLRGKRLQGELAKARLDEEAAKAQASAATDIGKSMVHLDQAEAHQQKAAQLQKTITTVSKMGEAEQAHLHAMPASEVTDAYLKMLQEKKP